MKKSRGKVDVDVLGQCNCGSVACVDTFGK